MRDEEFGPGQNTELGWNDPGFGLLRVAKVPMGSFQPSGEERYRVLPVYIQRCNRTGVREEANPNMERRIVQCQF